MAEIKNTVAKQGCYPSFASSIEQKRSCDTTEVQNSRTNMAVLHFVMTAPKWSLSLFFFLAAAHNPIPTPIEGVQKHIQRFRTAIAFESNSYQQCARQSMELLESELHVVAEEENERLLREHNTNQIQIKTSQARAAACFSSSRKVSDLLGQWQDFDNQIVWVNDPQICSENDREHVEGVLRGESRIIEQEVTSVWDEYVEESLHGYESLRIYAEARFQYDYEYFVGMRIQPALELLVSFSTIDHSFAFSVDDLSIGQLLAESLAKLHDILLSAERHIQALGTRLRQVSMSLDAFFTSYADVYGRLLKGAAFVQDVLPPGVPLPDFLQINSIPIAESLLPSISDFQTFEPDFQSAYLMVENTTQLCVELLENAISDLQSKSEHALRGAAERISEAVADMLVVADYNPPVFTDSSGHVSALIDEFEFQNKLGRAALEKSKALLNQLGNIELVDVQTSGHNASLASNGTAFVNDSTSFEYLRPFFPFMSIPDILAVLFDWLSSNTWIFEVVIQSIRLWRLEAAYSKGAVPDLPQIGYEESHTEAQPKTKQLILSMVLKIIFVPRFMVALLLTPLLLAATALWYPHVKTGCIDTQNGTFLATQFLFPIAVNNASAFGNAQYLRAEVQCHESQRKHCKRMEGRAQARLQIGVSTMSTVQAQHLQSIETLDAIKRCLSDGIMPQLNDGCCGLKGYGSCLNTTFAASCPVDQSAVPPIPFNQLDAYFEEETCIRESLQAATMRDSHFECERLAETCTKIPCAGVNVEALKYETIKADCEVEIYALQVFAFIVMVFYHAVLVNVICSLLFGGYRQYNWRKVCPEGIKLNTRLREDGTLVREGDCQDRAEKVSRAVKRYELTGKLQIASGLFVFFIWAASIVM